MYTDPTHKQNLDRMLDNVATGAAEDYLARYHHLMAPSVYSTYTKRLRYVRELNTKTARLRRAFTFDQLIRQTCLSVPCYCGKDSQHVDHVIPHTASSRFKLSSITTPDNNKTYPGEYLDLYNVTGQFTDRMLMNIAKAVGGNLLREVKAGMTANEFLRSKYNAQGLCAACNKAKAKREKSATSYVALYLDEMKRRKNMPRRKDSLQVKAIENSLGETMKRLQRETEIMNRKRKPYLDEYKAKHGQKIDWQDTPDNKIFPPELSSDKYYTAIIKAVVAKDRYLRSIEAGKVLPARRYDEIHPLLEGKKPGRTLAFYWEQVAKK